MWVSMAACTWVSGRLVHQDGNWVGHTRVWPRTRAPIDLACATIWSPGPKLNTPFDGSVVSHFISLPGVTMLNWLSETASSVGLLRLDWVRAVPKYLPCAAASCASDVVGTALAGTAAK